MESNVISPARLPASSRAPEAASQWGTPKSAAAAATAVWQALLGPAPTPADSLAALRAVSRVRSVAPGQPVFSQQDEARELVILVQGDVALGRAQPDAAFHTERSVHGPAWLDASSAWLDGPHLQDAVALGYCQVLGVTRQALQSVLLHHPELSPRLLGSQAEQVRGLIDVIHDLMHKDAEGRFAAWLLQRCAECAEGGDAGAPDADAAVVTLHERKRDIAAQLAITPETLSRLLRQLKRKGLIEVLGYTVRVLDMARLRALAAA